MLHRCKPRILLQGLALFLLGPMCEAFPLGLTVNVVPLESNGGQTVGNFSYSQQVQTF